MLVVFSPIFVVDTKITFVYNFVAPLIEAMYNKALPTIICLCPQSVKDNNRSPNHSKQSLPYLYHTNYTNGMALLLK